nr:hypothetical protein [Piscirickettsia salmonis]
MRAQWWSVPIPRHATLCDADSRGFIVVAFCSAILHHWMCKIPTEVATLTSRLNKIASLAKSPTKTVRSQCNHIFGINRGIL